MAITKITRDSQLKPGTAFGVVTNDASGNMTEVSLTASRAVATDANGTPVASVSTAAQLAYLAGLASLTVGDIINVKADGTLQDAAISSANLFLADGSVTATGNLFAGGFQLKGLADPTSAQDAATKNYVDSIANGITWKTAVQAATVGNLTATYANGTAGVGATLTNSGTQVALAIDGYTAAVNDRILVKNQSTTLQNGIYTVTNIGSGSTNWVLTRSTDMDTPAQVPSATVLTEEGTTNANTVWICNTVAPVTIGTTAITFVAFGTVSTYTAGNGLILTGNVFSISTDNSLTTNTSDPSLQVRNSLTGAITTVTDGLAVSVDGSTLTITSNALKVADGGITDTQVSASAAIASSKIAPGQVDGTITYTSGGQYVGSSGLTYDGTNFQITNGGASLLFDGNLHVAGSTILEQNYNLVFTDGGSNSVSLVAPNTVTASYSLSLPVADATGVQVLANPGDSSGLLYWASLPAAAGGAGQIQFSDGSGGFNASSSLVWDSVNGNLDIVGANINFNGNLINLQGEAAIQFNDGHSGTMQIIPSVVFSNKSFNVVSVDDGTDLTVDTTSGLSNGDTIVQGQYSTTITTVTDGTHLVVADTTNWSSGIAYDTTVSSAISWTLPASQGANGTVLTTDSAGHLSWTTPTSGPTFVTREVPSGTINGTNVTFTLANTPTTGTECVYLNGLLQNAGGNDYAISGATITFTTAPETASVILVNYQM